MCGGLNFTKNIDQLKSAYVEGVEGGGFEKQFIFLSFKKS
jgi:hypothetical protein